MDNVKRVPRNERAARTRRAIIAAATQEFRSSGYHGTTMSAIAKRAGVAVQRRCTSSSTPNPHC